jgi:hypothetical protein
MRKYIDLIVKQQTPMLLEMANLNKTVHGIDGVVLWIGRENKQHGLRVKVSNKRDRFDVNDNFVIQLPSLYYDHKQVANWISSKMLTKIFDWVNYHLKVASCIIEHTSFI